MNGRTIALTVTKVAEQQATFAWKYSVAGGISASVAATELATIYQRDGAVTPAAVVAAAREEEAPLHPAFEWDDVVAGERYRETQAEHMMRMLTVVYRKPDGAPTEPTRYLVKVKGAADDAVESDEVDLALAPRNYVPIQRVMDQTELRQRFVRQAYGELVAWRRRYQHIAELAEIFEAIDVASGAFEQPPT